jgi:hypothetical protein
MAVHGGILTTTSRRHRIAFLIYGIVGLMLIGAQGIYLYKDSHGQEQARKRLEDAIGNLQQQTQALMNALRLQVTLDDLKHLETVVTNGFGQIAHGKPTAPAKAQPSVPVPQAIRIIQRRAASTNANAPFGLQVVMQTDVTIQPVAFRVECDGEITDASVFIVGEPMYFVKATQISADRKSFLFSFHSPAFTPNGSLVVSLQAKSDIRVTKVVQIPPLV